MSDNQLFPFGIALQGAAIVATWSRSQFHYVAMFISWLSFERVAPSICSQESPTYGSGKLFIYLSSIAITNAFWNLSCSFTHNTLGIARVHCSCIARLNYVVRAMLRQCNAGCHPIVNNCHAFNFRFQTLTSLHRTCYY